MNNSTTTPAEAQSMIHRLFIAEQTLRTCAPEGVVACHAEVRAAEDAIRDALVGPDRLGEPDRFGITRRGEW